MADTNQILSNPSKTIVFALPGRTYSREFLLSWSNLLFELIKNNIKPIISQNFSSMVHFSRMRCLGGNVLKGKTQKPFQSEVDYDYIMWIDSDQVFDAKQFFELLESPYEVTSGMYLMEDTKHYPIVKDWNKDYFIKNGTFGFMTPDEIEKVPKVDGKYLKVAYTGMGWMLIKKGVIDKIEYPWFYRALEKLDGDIQDISSEDVSFCRNLTDAGVEIWVDCQCRIGHQKSFVI
jgi:hypothetical protein